MRQQKRLNIKRQPPNEKTQKGNWKEKAKKNLVHEDDIVFALSKLPTILGNDDFEEKQEIKREQKKGIDDEINLTRLKEEMDSGETPWEIEFYFGGPNQNFF